MIGGGSEPCNIGDHASTDSDDHIVTRETRLSEGAAQRCNRCQRLMFFANTDFVDCDLMVGKMRNKRSRDSRLRHDCNSLGFLWKK